MKLLDPGSCRLLAVLRGHTGTIAGLAFSPDGRLLASSSDDRTAKLWSVATKREVATLRGHTDWVMAVAFSPDGRTLATASNDNTARLWDVTSHRSLAVLAGPTGGVSAVAFSRDGKTLATGSDDHTVKLWNVATAQPTITLTGHSGAVQGLAFTPDGKTLISGAWDGTVRLWRTVRAPAAPRPSQRRAAGSPIKLDLFATKWLLHLLAIQPPPAHAGLEARYFASADQNEPGAPGRLLLLRIDPAIDFDWNSRSPAKAVPREDYQVRWTGVLRAPIAGTYGLQLITDDGGRLFVDGQPLIDNWYDQGPIGMRQEVYLAAGWHRLRVEYYQHRGGAEARLRWNYPFGAGPRAIPPRFLGHGSKFQEDPRRPAIPLGGSTSGSSEARPSADAARSSR